MARLIVSSTKAASARILEPVPPERAFYFYAEVGRPVGTVASSLKEFGGALKTVEVGSLEFHLQRGDFERWVTMLGDNDLARSVSGMKQLHLTGEKLRSELVRVVQTRVRQLQRTPSKK
jgi:hypothetical protein